MHLTRKIPVICLSAWGATLAPSAAEALVVANDPGAVVAFGSMPAVPRVGSCGGALLWDGLHVLTAAHCSPSSGGMTSVTFDTLSGPVVISATATVNPGWNGKTGVNGGNDLSILTLSAKAPVPGYQIYRDTGLSGPTEITLFGYGLSGTGVAGSTSGSGGTLRGGTNTYDVIYTIIPGGPYLFDMDQQGNPAHDSIGGEFGVHNLGTGATEATLAPGDSGGPSFIDGELAGIHSFQMNPGSPYVTPGAGSDSYGWIGGDTRVAAYAGWIDSVMGVPEPRQWTLTSAGLLATLAALHWRRLQAVRSSARKRVPESGFGV